MNREQWQQKRGHAGAKRAPAVLAAAEVAYRAQTTPPAGGAAKPAAEPGSQTQTGKSAAAIRRPKP
jgi:hypothetical protein